MSVRGTRNLLGADADALVDIQTRLERIVRLEGFQRFIPSLLANKSMFEGKIGDNRMYEFEDRAHRALVLLPEVTHIAAQEYAEVWSKTMPKPVKIFYTTKCFRYDRPQRGRYREFTQFGVEILGPGEHHADTLMDRVLEEVGLSGYVNACNALRGQSYYTNGEGWEVRKDNLQIAGGGRYACGEGWAIGLERLLLVL